MTKKELVEVHTGEMVTTQEPKALTVNEMLDKINNLEDFIQKALKKGVDYGTVPGIPKPFLQLPGGQKLGALFSLVADDFVIVDKIVDFDRTWEYQTYDKEIGRAHV